MKLTITAAAALIGLATVFGSAGAAPTASLPDGTPVIEVGGRNSGDQGGGCSFGHGGGGRRFGNRGGGRNFGHGGGHRSGHRGNGHNFGHNRHGYYPPYVYGGIAYGT
jgi:hypothetical protein